MNGRTLPMERVPLTEAEKEYLAPIIDRWETLQKDAQQTQKDIDAVVKLFMAQHKDELSDNDGWQLGRDAFVRQVPKVEPQTNMPPVNGGIEDEIVEMMR